MEENQLQTFTNHVHPVLQPMCDVNVSCCILSIHTVKLSNKERFDMEQIGVHYDNKLTKNIRPTDIQ